MKELFCISLRSTSNTTKKFLIAVNTSDPNVGNITKIYGIDGIYYKVGKSVVIDNIKFEFEQNFIDELYSFKIYVRRDNKNGKLVYVRTNLVTGSLSTYYEFIFKLGNKNKIHFWNDLDYIMENLVARFSNYMSIPIAKQMSDITKLTLRRI